MLVLLGYALHYGIGALGIPFNAGRYPCKLRSEIQENQKACKVGVSRSPWAVSYDLAYLRLLRFDC